MTSDQKVTIAIIGAGSRGLDAYANYALERPDLLDVVAVAEPREAYRQKAVERFGIPESNVFAGWEEFVAQPKLADAVIIATQDRLHTAPSLACIEKGYDILLEKPMATSEAECRQIVDAALAKNSILAVGHVLRYTAYFRKLKELVQSGVIGEISGIRHIEGIANWHYAHSYVRGNWGNTEQASPILLAKCCHDVDILSFLTDRKCLRVGSFGGRKHFCRDCQPEGAADRCLDCPLQDSCLYSAPKFYLSRFESGNYNWPVNVVVSEFTREALLEALRTGPYGRCVYACDNDVVEEQTLMLEYDGGIYASMTMTAFSEGRRTEIYGTLGEIHSSFEQIEIRRFGADKPEIIDMKTISESITSGHGGGDFGLAADFVEAVKSRNPDILSSGPEVTLESHLITFAAEESRNCGRIVDLV